MIRSLIFIIISSYIILPQSIFEYKYGVGGSQIGSKIIRTSNNEYLIAGKLYTSPICFMIDQFGSVKWSKLYRYAWTDYEFEIMESFDHNFYLVGSQGLNPIEDVWIIKFDALGEVVWNKLFGVSGARELGQVICSGINSGCLIVGTSHEDFEGYGAYLIKLNDEGQAEWTKKIIQSEVNPYSSQSIIKSHDNTYVLATTLTNYSRDIALVKIASNGNLLWNKTYGGSADEYPLAISQLPDSGFILTGYTSSFNSSSYDIIVFRTNKIGNVLWSKVIGGTGLDWCKEIVFIPDSTLFLVGGTNSFDAYDAIIMKLNISGSIDWIKKYGGSNEQAFKSLISTPDSGLMVIGFTNNVLPKEYKVYVLKTDFQGNAECGSEDVSFNIRNASLLTGSLPLYTKNYGTEIGTQIFVNDYPVYKFDSCRVLTPVELESFNAEVDKNTIVLKWATSSEKNNYGFEIERKFNLEKWCTIGFKEGNGTTTNTNSYSFKDDNLSSGKYSYRLKQIDYNGSYEYYDLNEIIEVDVPSKFELFQNYPNPFNPSTRIQYQVSSNSRVSLKVYDVLGNEVATLVDEQKPAGIYVVEFRIENLELSSGVYFYRLRAGNYIQTKKMIILR